MIGFLKKYLPPKLIFWLLVLLGFNGLAYYGARIINEGRVHYDISIAADSWFPLIPAFTIVYFGCYITWSLGYIIIYHLNRDDAHRFYLADIMAKLACFAIFIIIPTSMERPAVPDGFFGNILGLLYKVDAPDNLFPSIHCLESWFGFIAYRARKDVSPWIKIGFFVLAILVFLSTLYTKQHLLADVAGGIILAELCWLLSGLLMKKLKKRRAKASAA